MFSNRLTELKRWALAHAGRRPSRWSIRGKLLAAMLALFTVVSLAVGVVSVVALGQFLTGQLDQQLGAVSIRVLGPGARGMGPPMPPGEPRNGFELIPYGTPVSAIGARITGGQVETGLILIDSPSPTPGRGSTLKPLTVAESAPLVNVPTDGRPHTVTLADLGDYRLLAGKAGGDVVVTGLPLADVQATVWRLVWTEVIVFGLGLLVAGGAGIAIVRLSLRPLSRVAETAGRVAELPLARGEVDLWVRVPDTDTDPRTEVGRVGAALNRLLGHVAEALAVRQASETRVRQFVADASHELRTPLAAIRGYAELTRRSREPVPADIGHALSRIESESRRMTTLVDDLLLLARLDSGRPLERESVELSRLVVDAVNDQHAAGPEHHWLLNLPNDGAVTVPGDSQRLHQVLANLLANARTHTPAGTTVTTSLAVWEEQAIIAVSDDGSGIPAELLPEIFERFARGDSSRSRAAGSTGLGLAIVAAVVEAHHGTVEVTSVPGQTVFVVRLPGAAAG